MDIYESLNSILVTLFNDIMNIEEKALITDEFSDITVTDMHIIEAIGRATHYGNNIKGLRRDYGNSYSRH